MPTKTKTKATPPKKSALKPPLKGTAASSKSPTPPKAPATASGSKLDQIQSALTTPDGATLAALMKVTGWQAHSVRGALAGALKVKRKLTIGSEVREGVRFYRIEGQQ
jgi:hypothetical protein